MNRIPKTIALLLCLTLGTGLFAGCQSKGKTAASTSVTQTTESGYDDNDFYSDYTKDSPVEIALNADSASTKGSGVSINGSKIKITTAGTYVLSGTLTDGQILVEAGENDVVRLVLKDAAITSSTSAPIYTKSAKKTIISLPAGTQNALTDATSYTLESADLDKPSGALFSKDDLTINGSGTLNLTANFNDGIVSKDTLKIMEGTLNLTVADDALIGKDSLKIKDGIFTLNAGGDGLKASNDTDAGQGNITVNGGTFNITAGADGIQGETAVTIDGGDFTLNTGGGSANSSDQSGTAGNTWGNWGGGKSAAPQGAEYPAGTTPDDTQNTTESEVTEDTTASAKGIKATGAISIKGGTFNIDSSDDAIHSNDSATLSGGTITISSGDDGIHADTSLIINDGIITINKSYEGLESNTITIAGGSTTVKAIDDGVNVAGGNDSSSTSGRPGENNISSSGGSTLHIDGGTLNVDASGDGLDANGSIIMTGGNVTINGPENSGNGALDYDGTFEIERGELMAAASAGMVQTPSTGSTQYSLNTTFPSTLAAGTVVEIKDADGTVIKTVMPEKAFQSLILSTPEFKNGSTYTLSISGTTFGTFTLSNVITNLSQNGVTSGVQQSGPGGGGGGGKTPPGM